jgi:hypothetical protein
MIGVVAFVVRLVTSILALTWLGLRFNLTAAVVLAVVGLVLGLTHAICNDSGKTYRDTPKSWFLLLVDHTWSLPNTIFGSVYVIVLLALGMRPKPQPAYATHRIALLFGGRLMHGWSGTTIGPVEVSKEADLTNPSTRDWERKDAMDTNTHEYVHVFQARLFGPLYFPLVVAHYIVAALLPYWLLYHYRKKNPIDSVGNYFANGVYTHVWNEKWAYYVAP